MTDFVIYLRTQCAFTDDAAAAMYLLPCLITTLYCLSLLGSHAVSAAATGDHVLSAQDIIAPYVSNGEQVKQFADAPVLTYITPWNKNGYTYSVQYASKLNIVSPVWYTMQISMKKQKQAATAGGGSGGGGGKPKFSVHIDGNHNVDPYWLAQLHNTTTANLQHTVHITPRVLLEYDNAQTVVQLMRSQKLQKHLITQLVDLVKRNKYDGLVLECTTMWPIVAQAYAQSPVPVQQQHRSTVNQFVIALSMALKAQDTNALLILVVRPHYDKTPYYTYADFVQTQPHIDYISLMTYDYSSGSAKPGPNAPYDWVKQSVHKLLGDKNLNDPAVTRKVLLGLNMYGIQWQSGGQLAQQPTPVVAHEWVGVVSEAVSNGDAVDIVWQPEFSEHRMTVHHISDNVYTKTMYVPTPDSVKVRMTLAAEMNVGVSLWELGQANEHLIDVL